MDTQFNSKYPHYLFWHFLYRHRLGKTLNYTSNLLKIVPCHFIWVKGLNMPINFSYQMFWPAILSKMTWQFIGLLLFHLWFLKFCHFNSKVHILWVPKRCKSFMYLFNIFFLIFCLLKDIIRSDTLANTEVRYWPNILEIQAFMISILTLRHNSEWVTICVDHIRHSNIHCLSLTSQQ